MTEAILVVLDSDQSNARIVRRMQQALDITPLVVDFRADCIRGGEEDDDDDEVRPIRWQVCRDRDVRREIPTGPGTYMRESGGTWQILGYTVDYAGLDDVLAAACAAAFASGRIRPLL